MNQNHLGRSIVACLNCLADPLLLFAGERRLLQFFENGSGSLGTDGEFLLPASQPRRHANKERKSAVHGLDSVMDWRTCLATPLCDATASSRSISASASARLPSCT